MIKITAEFDKNRVQGEFKDFDAVHEWLATVALLQTEQKKKQCIGFTGQETDVCEEDETQSDETDEKETD
jgi:hypothetical protein